MEPSIEPLKIFQLRIVLNGISPLIWRRVLLPNTTTLARLHDIIQILFGWGDEHLYHFHIFGQDYGRGEKDADKADLNQFRLHQGEHFRYIYNYYVHWICEIRLEATLPFDLKRYYPVCFGGKNASPSEEFAGAKAYLEQLDRHTWDFPLDSMPVIADALKTLMDSEPHEPVREAIGDLEALRKASNHLNEYDRFRPSDFQRNPINSELRNRISQGGKAS